MEQNIDVVPYSPNAASEGEMRACYALFAAEVRENFPEAPVIGYSAYADQLRSEDTSIGRRLLWRACAGDDLLGLATAAFLGEENTNMAIVNVRVRPQSRRQGVGTAMLRAMLPELAAQDRSLITGYGLVAGGSGERWANALGFARVQRRIWQKLTIPDVDSSLWQIPVPEGFRLETWTDAAPESLLVAYARARSARLDAPRGSATYEQPIWTAERVRRLEAELRAIGEEHWVVAAVHEADATVAAFTEISFVNGENEVAWQDDTAVAREFRGRGLGRVVKGGMMRRLLALRPSIKVLRTDVSAENVHMLRVNEQLGYTELSSVVNVETSLESLAKAVARVTPPPPRAQAEH